MADEPNAGDVAAPETVADPAAAADASPAAGAEAAAELALEPEAAPKARAGKPVVIVVTTSRLWVDGKPVRRGQMVLASADRFQALARVKPARARLATKAETPKDTSTLVTLP